jgi:hypothetical protein
MVSTVLNFIRVIKKTIFNTIQGNHTLYQTLSIIYLQKNKKTA